ncbi:kinase-like domain-containing protein [Diaporthe sp. PMI_573]|nr:kinase-like domain-containing protein [Diaporthaceae sp. PMI_573]
MAHLSTYGADFSVTKKKAIEDAKKMQVVVEDECNKAEQEVPLYLLRELIGKGSFGRVYKATDLKTSQLVAVKIIDIEESDTLNPKLADTYSEFLKEINALKLLSEGGAKNINHVLDALPVGQSMWMVTEYCAGGSVATLMKPTAPGGLQEKWIIPILREVAEAVHWVHKAGIIHRDIKCANVLITEAGGVQLCDFGVSGVIETKFDKRSTFIGTPHWMAPELFDPSASYGVEVDIWAFGSMVFEIASGLPPNVMAGIDITQLGGYLKQNTPRLEGNKYSEKLKDLVSFCLVEDPAQRPTINDVQRHPYLHNTSSSHPTSSLAMLVRAFRVWESQGGSRKSLFAFGGAQGPSGPDLSSTAMSNDEWNFSTTLAFDQRVMNSTDAQAVYDVYGSNVDLMEATPQPYRSKRRRPPPNLPVMRAPLEKIFDPNTITSYNENARKYYGNPPSPPAADFISDLPLRDSSHNATLRESLIDLDASLHGSDLSRFADMNTVRASVRRSNEYDLGEDYSRAPNSDPETVLAASNRKTQDWKFPAMVPPASASAEMSHFPFNEDRNSNPDSASDWKFPGPGDRQPGSASEWKFPGPSDRQPGSASEWKFPDTGSRPPLLHHPTEPLGSSPSYNESLMVPRAASQMENRASVSSLIDLDESLPEPVAPADIIRPSTANSDVGSEIGGAFDLEKHASYYPLPSTNREPSIYISDESDFAGLAGHRQTRSINMMGGIPEVDERQRRNTGAFMDDSHLYSGDEYNGSEDYMMTGSSTATRSQASYQHGRGPNGMASASDGSLLPPLPAPPSERVMMGEGGELMRDEFLKLLEGMTSHLSFTGEFVGNLPTRKSGRGQESQNGQ